MAVSVSATGSRQSATLRYDSLQFPGLWTSFILYSNRQIPNSYWRLAQKLLTQATLCRAPAWMFANRRSHPHLEQNKHHGRNRCQHFTWC